VCEQETYKNANQASLDGCLVGKGPGQRGESGTIICSPAMFAMQHNKAAKSSAMRLSHPFNLLQVKNEFFSKNWSVSPYFCARVSLSLSLISSCTHQRARWARLNVCGAEVLSNDNDDT